MIRLLFFLRFKSQLYRTIPDTIGDLESSVIQAFENAGGKVKNERRLLTASLDGSSLGIWLDILILIEKVIKIVEGAAFDLYGYSLVIGRDIPPKDEERICSLLSLDPEKNHVYCDPAAQGSLGCYAYFERVPSRLWKGELGSAFSFARLTGFRSFPENMADPFALKETILELVTQAGQKNFLLLGPELPGKRNGLYGYGEKLLGGCPPLAIRFGGGRGLSPLSDALSPRIRAFIETAGIPADLLAELDSLSAMMFRERLRAEVLPAAERQGRRFFRLLLESYAAGLRLKSIQPLVILENIHQADPAAAGILQDTLQEAAARGRILVYGTAGGSFFSEPRGGRIKEWEKVFPKVFRLDTKGEHADFIPRDIPPDLWEIAYALELLSRYFPEETLGQLLEEGGKNPQTVSRALAILGSLGLVDRAGMPRPQIEDFSAKAEPVLGERKRPVQALVCRLLLDWVFRRKIGPCFGLLEILVSLENEAAAAPMRDELIFKSVNADLSNGAYREIERAITGGYLENVVGTQRAFTVDYLFRSARALLHGTGGQIREAFQVLPQMERLYPPYRAKILANITSYHLGLRDSAAASATIKEAIMLSQDKPWSGLAQSYRLFSLVNLSKQRIGETLEYASFAVENAEKSDNLEERGIASYYAAAAQTLLGNFALALRFAGEAEAKFAAAGQFEWVDYARFFQGRLAFDLGRYREAGGIFEDVRGNSAGVSDPVKKGLLAAWAYRSRIYFQNPLAPKPEGGGIDGDLFEIEAAYFVGDYERAAELAARFSSATMPREYFLFTEQPDWNSGFAQNELLLLHPAEFWNRMISAYRALALCRVSPAGGEEALRIMQRILRDERLAETDPGDAFYFYAWYQVLERSGAAQSDMNTALSMAFKRLQRRASRIDDIETRKIFLSQPRWNGALSLAAKEYKLI
jgi:DNA-binding transcriptional ArsR family regulator